MHTMEMTLIDYLKNKMHPSLAVFKGNKVIVRGKYDRNHSIISTLEKNDKLFNWKRPTVEFSPDNETIFVNCFPGRDYVNHYAEMIRTHFRVNNISENEIIMQSPLYVDTYQTFLRSNITFLERVDIVIFGTVERLWELTKSAWQGDGDFCWSIKKLSGCKIALLGCKFSIWGDASYALVEILAKMGVKSFIYVGKLGGLHPKMTPNQLLASGCQSVVKNKTIFWENHIDVSEKFKNILFGRHITLYSTMAETKDWLQSIGHCYDFVDPEIGHMALASRKHRLSFSYIHIVSDNVANPKDENLSNERNEEIQTKRARLYNQLLEILDRSLSKLVNK